LARNLTRLWARRGRSFHVNSCWQRWLHLRIRLWTFVFHQTRCVPNASHSNKI
jgi:hypothetical protein